VYYYRTRFYNKTLSFTFFCSKSIGIYVIQHWYAISTSKIIVTVSGKTGLITSIKKWWFKYSRCCNYNLPMVVATRTKFSHVLQQCITFQILQWRSSEQLSFLPFYIVFKPRLTVSGDVQKGWVAGAWKVGKMVWKIFMRKVYGWIRPSYKPFRAQNWLKWKEFKTTSHNPTPRSCTATHSHLLVGQGSVKATDYSYSLPQYLKKAARKSRSLYSGSLWSWCLIVHSSSFVFV